MISKKPIGNNDGHIFLGLGRVKVNVISRAVDIACYILIGVYCIFSIYLVSGLWTKPGLFYQTGNPAGADFLQIWAGSSLALKGQAILVYNPEALKVAEIAAVGGDFKDYLPWHYPPSFLLLTLPVSLFPYLGALVIWLGVPLCGLLFVIYRIAPHPLSLKLSLAFPATAFNLHYGQGAYLITFLLGSGVLLLDSCPIVSGILFSLVLNYKPHLGLLAIIALLSGRHWKSLGGVIMTTAALMLASIWVFGMDSWIAFYQNITNASLQLKNDSYLWEKMPTIFATVRLQGGDVWIATIFQFLISGGAILLVFLCWYRNYPLAVRGPALVLGTLLCSPHVLEYDLTLLLLPMAWFAWEHLQNNWRTLKTILVFLVWYSPIADVGISRITKWHIEPLIIAIFLVIVVKLGIRMGFRCEDRATSPTV